jgi:DtxR family Mn-dependent transcriptional regulator
MTEKLTGSMEDYLEAIHVLAEQKSKVRVKHIADFLGVSRPSVVSAVSHLHEKGLVEHARYGDVRLTERGGEVAREIYGRHVILRRFLQAFLGLPRLLAERDACRMEHLLDPRTVERIEAFLDYLETSEDSQEWLAGFQRYVDGPQ